MARTLHRAEPVHNELKRLAEARNQTYEMSALLAEFIDNSNSARRTPDQLVQVNLRVYKDDETDQLVLSVTDNASGIPDTSLGLIIGRGNSIGGGVNNEHGVGLKNAALNGSQYLRKLETKTLNASTSSVITFTCAEDTLQPFDIKDGTFLKSSGTRLEIVLPSEHALLNPESYYNALSELQVIYGKALGSRLSIEARNDVLGIPSLTLQGDPVARHLANPVKADQSWIVEKKIKGAKAIPWTATLKVGFISPESLRPELPRTAGETKTPLHRSKHGRSIQNQGIYFYKGDRLIVRTDNWTMGGMNVLDGRRGSNKHNDINGLVLEVHLDQHFSTTPTKNAYPNTPQYQELQKEIRAFLVGRFLPDLNEGQKYADERDNQCPLRAIERRHKGPENHDGKRGHHGRKGDHDDDRDGRRGPPPGDMPPPPAEQGALPPPPADGAMRQGAADLAVDPAEVRMALTSAGYSDIGQISQDGPRILALAVNPEGEPVALELDQQGEVMREINR